MPSEEDQQAWHLAKHGGKLKGATRRTHTDRRSWLMMVPNSVHWRPLSDDEERRLTENGAVWAPPREAAKRDPEPSMRLIRHKGLVSRRAELSAEALVEMGFSHEEAKAQMADGQERMSYVAQTYCVECSVESSTEVWHAKTNAPPMTSDGVILYSTTDPYQGEAEALAFTPFVVTKPGSSSG